MDKWISVDNTLPKIGEDVLICTEKGQIKISCWFGNKGRTDDGQNHRKNWKWPGNIRPTVLYWMPLPLAPKSINYVKKSCTQIYRRDS